MRKKQTILLLSTLASMLWLFPLASIAQEKAAEKAFEEPVFTVVHKVEISSVKSQGSTGTCWCFGTTSMIESEIMRLGKTGIGISEMYSVRNLLSDRAEQYVRFHGTTNFEQGGAQHDVMTAVKKYGMVPREVYPGLNYGSTTHSHGEILSVLKGVVQNVTKNRNGVISPVWKDGFSGILDAYFGENPTEFTYKGKSFTPQSFATASGINPDDYVEFSSYTHHPFFEEFVLEVPDNWAQKYMYNVPIDDLMSIVDNAIEKGISISWAADISGLNYSAGVGLIPADGENAKNLMATEKEISQNDRQYMFDHYQLTDDHCMHIIGLATDQNGKKYYIEKNSWGEGGKYKGFSYMSESFMRLRTMSIMIHKDAVPERLARKIGLK
ncbi:MAG: aminopeptidase [Bacteroidales bacterium]|nr:aminopeptidase [Bacteroidales bacterium]